ncbi:hypothetical protein [Lactobacillus terrae]|uniref:hypothetical protein n=1 Tax=Lactobacillus terrae TaxID=2269374 RepID=UPI000C1B6805|nr:hypothetical protein [Lactobacillus terrae]
MLKTSKNIYLSGTSTDENDKLLSRFTANFDETGKFTVNENAFYSGTNETADKDFDKFRVTAKQQADALVNGGE